MLQDIELTDELSDMLADVIDHHGGFANWPQYPEGAETKWNLLTEYDEKGDLIASGIVLTNAKMGVGQND